MMFILLSLLFWILPQNGFAAELFNDFYSENSGFLKTQTVATYFQLRSGLRASSDWETYAATRFGGDTRTALGADDAIYNDNYLFLGLGVDYLGLLPGVRAVAQVGVSEDMNRKINLGGPDGRFGFMSYHELHGSSPFYAEIYSEELYVHRYRNILATVQARILQDWFVLNTGGRSRRLVLSPLANFVLSADSEGLDYNRFAEARLGFRLSLNGPITFILNPYYALGTRWERPTDYPTYQDFRLLVVAAAAF